MTVKDQTKLIASTAIDLIEKKGQQGDRSDVLTMIAQPFISGWLANHGFTTVGPLFGGNKNVFDQHMDQQRQTDKWKAMAVASQGDRGTHVSLLKGVANLLGVEANDDRNQMIESAAGDIATVAPYMMEMFPDFWDRIHGSKGSAMSLASAIMDSRSRVGRISPEEASQAANQVLNEFQQDPQLSRGFSARELGEIYQQMYERGMAPGSLSSKAMTSALGGEVKVMSALRDQAGMSGHTPSINELYQELDHSGMTMMPRTDVLENRIRRQGYLGPGGEFATALRQTGGAAPAFGAAGMDELVGMDNQLMQQAMASPAANIMGATGRLVENMGLDPSIVQQSAGMGRTEWMGLMEQQGVPAHLANEMLRHTAMNQQYVMNNDLARDIRGHQMADVQNVFDRAYPQRPGEPDFVYQGRLQESAKRNPYLKGYGSYENIKRLQGRGITDAVKRVGSEADQLANAQKQMSGMFQADPVRRVSDLIRSAPADMSAVDFGAKAIGAIPQSEIPQNIQNMFKTSAEDEAIALAKAALDKVERKKPGNTSGNIDDVVDHMEQGGGGPSPDPAGGVGQGAVGVAPSSAGGGAGGAGAGGGGGGM
jgi:hypothetical protein